MVKRILTIIAISLLALVSYGQHRYLATVKNVYSEDSVKAVCNMFTDLKAISCEYSQANHYFKIETKNFLPRVIVEDYFICQGYYITFFVEVEDRPILFKMPAKKDSIIVE
jgi:hypothetical protein